MPGVILDAENTADPEFAREALERITRMKEAVGPGSVPLSEEDMLAIGNEILRYYNLWDALTVECHTDLNLVFFFWEKKQDEIPISEELVSLATIITIKQVLINNH